jgi:hypothetical protein
MVDGGGIVVAPSHDGWWAWSALRIVPAASAPERPGQPDLAGRQPVDQRVFNQMSGSAETVVQAGEIGAVHIHQLPAVAPDDTPWLRAAWDTVLRGGAGEAVIDLRYLHEVDPQRLTAFLVVRTRSADRQTAISQAVDLRTNLAGPLRQDIVAVPITVDAVVRGVLAPLAPDPAGLVEIRKRITVARTSRGDAGSQWLAAVTPLHNSRPSLDSLWTTVAAMRCRVLLAVRLTPLSIGHGMRAHLTARAQEFARLARQGPSPTGVFSQPRPADPFAVAAQPLFADAVGRYTDRAFHLGITLASDSRVPNELAELVANLVSPKVPGTGFAGDPPVVVRPMSHDEHATAWRNVTSAAYQPLPVAYLQGHPPGSVGPVEWRLSEIADVDEAAAAFRLPSDLVSD